MSYLGDAARRRPDEHRGRARSPANYDGTRKHRTTIGEGAFIGVDTMLVAPVEIGDGAKTGAGAVVTHDVPPGRLAVGVPARLREPRPTPGEPTSRRRRRDPSDEPARYPSSSSSPS